MTIVGSCRRCNVGVKVAASRKLDHELGIPQIQTPVDQFQYLTKIHYLAPSTGLWGEHEGMVTSRDMGLFVDSIDSGLHSVSYGGRYCHSQRQ